MHAPGPLLDRTRQDGAHGRPKELGAAAHLADRRAHELLEAHVDRNWISR
jgi:hypothetical protein